VAFQKYASAEVLEVKRSSSRLDGGLQRFASHRDEDYISDEGYLYVRVRAISSRTNKNYDSFASNELKKAYSTFLHRPIFVEHRNDDPRRARGIIVDTKLHIEDAKTSKLDPFYSSVDALPEHSPPTWIELLLEVDAKTFPKLAKAILDGDFDAVSMGCNVEQTRCTVCSNVAKDASEFCQHIQHRGAYYDSYDESGRRTSKLAAELCEGVNFFEISWVGDPADTTALADRDSIRQAVHKEAEDRLPREEQIKAPVSVDTLRQDQSCTLCGSDMREGKCEACGFEVPPEGLNNPDLDRAKKVDKKIQEQKALMEIKKRREQAPVPQTPNVQGPPGPVSNEIRSSWQRVAAVNPKERPILPPTKALSDEPKSKRVVKDSPKPVESNVKTSDSTSTAPDTTTDVEGVGGVMEPPKAETQNVDKSVSTVGDHTDTWDVGEGNSAGQEDPVGAETFEKDGSTEKTALEIDAPSQNLVDVDADLAEEVGPPTSTWTEDNSEPAVTDEEGVGGGPIGESAAKSSSRIYAALKVAELETELGISPADEKYERAASLEDESEETLNARLETLAKVKTARVVAPAPAPKLAGRMPSMRESAAPAREPAQVNTEDSSLFL
jgi:hypothetical protein